MFYFIFNFIFKFVSLLWPCFVLEELTLSGQLKVIPSIKPLFTRKLDALEVIEGRNARFDCRVSGTPPPKVSWGHFGRRPIFIMFTQPNNFL